MNPRSTCLVLCAADLKVVRGEGVVRGIEVGIEVCFGDIFRKCLTLLYNVSVPTFSEMLQSMYHEL